MHKKNTFSFSLILFFFILSIFFYLLMIDRKPNEIPSALLNKNFPNFETNSLLKKEKFIFNKEFQNESTIVNFFATWCKPCRDEHFFINKLSKEKKIKIIGINYKDNPKKAIQWLEELGNPYSSIAVDKNGRIGIDWGVYGIPETFIIDSEGIIKYRHVGPIDKKIYKSIDKIISDINEK